jgi:hypothetical protein
LQSLGTHLVFECTGYANSGMLAAAKWLDLQNEEHKFIQ